MNRKSRSRMKRGLIIIGIIAFIVGIMSACGAMRSGVKESESREPIIGIVTDKYTKRMSDTDKFFIVIEEENGTSRVLENTDSLFVGKYDSADVQAQVRKGKKYEIETFGIRSQVMSMYPNVIEVKALK